jgi:cyclic-di-GMP-binding biofilm dispersal mediator protein
MSSLENKTILVIGDSGGLGSCLTRQLQAAGASVLGASSLQVNLNSEESIERFCTGIATSGIGIDGIVLAAGLVAFGTIEETPSTITSRLMQVNFLGQISLVQKFMGKLTESAAAGKEPFIVSISGVIAENPMAGLAAYSASKTALHGFAQAGTRELRKAGIRWIDARPGHTDTGLASRAIFGTAPAFGAGLTPEKVASRIVEAIVQNEKDLPSTSFTNSAA